MTHVFRYALLIVALVVCFAGCGNPTAEDLMLSAGQKQTNGDSAGALADLNKAALLEPDNPKVFFVRGVTHSMNGNNEAALADYERAIELDPSLEEGLRMQMDAMR
jgi:Flp pilus assembly protein TadD